MLVSHEVPLILLEESFEFNDYDYCLPMFWEHKRYRNHFIKAREKGRFIILDNGLFEGKLESKETLLEIAEIIQPDVVISPDAWNDAKLTTEYYLEWKDIINPSKLMVVLQAKNGFEAKELYEFLVEDGVKYIGFNHLGTFYDDFGVNPNPSLRKTLGRINFTHSVGLSDNVHHHLLGTNIADEFKYYNLPQIKTLDTSNPVILAWEGKDYTLPHTEKPKTKMESLMDYEFDNFGQMNRFRLKALDNIKYFRNNYINK